MLIAPEEEWVDRWNPTECLIWAKDDYKSCTDHNRIKYGFAKWIRRSFK